MSEKHQCLLTISRSKAEQAKLPTWEIMDQIEQEARRELMNYTASRGFCVQAEDIWLDWTRQKNPDRFELRAWVVPNATP